MGDDSTQPQSANYPMPQSMMPGMQAADQDRIHVEIDLANPGDDPGPYGPDQFQLVSPAGQWPLNDFTIVPGTLAGGYSADLDLYFDVPAGQTDLSIRWSVGGEAVEIPLAVGEAPAHDQPEHGGSDQAEPEHGPTRAGFTVGMLTGDPQRNGVAVGLNPDSSVPPGGSRIYAYYVDKEVGTTIALNLAHETSIARGGAYAAVIAEPAGAQYRHPVTGDPLLSGLAADIRAPNGVEFREFVTLANTDEHDAGHSIMEYDADTDDGVFNYVQESLFEREGVGEEEEGAGVFQEEEGLERFEVFSTTEFGEDPTTVYQAHAGDQVRYRVAVPAGNFPLEFHVEGHAYPLDHGINRSLVIDTRNVMPGQTFDAHLIRGAGGAMRGTGDYLVHQHQGVFLQPGWWGIFRVLPPGDPSIRAL
jgi:hypothetical protein